MKTATDPRHTARKLSLSAIFCWLFSDPDTDQCVVLSEELLGSKETTTDSELIDFIISGVRRNRTKIDHIIEESAPEWPLDKISKVDLVILRIAVFELLYGNKAPVKVIIDEAIELAKEFGNDTSSKFINGVLGFVVANYIETADKEDSKNE